VPIGTILKNDHSFGPEDIANLTAAFEAALARLALTDRKDPLTTAASASFVVLHAAPFMPIASFPRGPGLDASDPQRS